MINLKKRSHDIERKNIVLLITSGQLNGFGTSIYDYANKLVIAASGSKANFYMGLYQASEIIVQLIFSLFGGVVADLNNRKRVLIITDFIASVLTFFVYLTYSKNNIIILIVTNIVLAVLFSFNAPAYKAIVSDLLGKNNINKYNSYSKTIAEFISIFSPMVGMLIIAFFGFKFGMLINSLSFLLSGILEIYFVELKISEKSKNTSKISSIKYGFIYIYKNKELFILLISSSIINFFYSGVTFYLPFIGQMYNQNNLYGIVLVGQAAGNITGAILNGFIKKKYSSNQYSSFLLLSSIPLVLIPLFNIWWITLFLFSLSSLFMTIFNIQMLSSLQMTIEQEYLGRVFSVITLFALMFIPLGTALFSCLNIKNLVVFGIVGIGQFLTCVILKISLKKIYRIY